MNTGSVLAQFTITLSLAVNEPVSVEWFTSDGTAKAGVDYAANRGTVVFAPGQVAKTVDILVYGRAVGTEDRSFYVEMLPPTNAILGTQIGECIIHVDTTGSQPVTEIIIPTGPRGIQGKSAYQTWLDLGNTGTEQDFINSLKPNAEDIADDVLPLLNVGDAAITSDGTGGLSKPDATTVKAVARRVAYASAARISTAVLANGDNTLSPSNLTGATIDFLASGFVPRVLHNNVFSEPAWEIDATGKLVIKGATAGDVLYATQYDLVSAKYPLARRAEVVKVDGRIDSLISDLGNSDGFKKIGRCASIAALRNVEPTANKQLISVTEHTAGKKLGGGFFEHDSSDTSSADDNGVVIVTTGGKRWKRITDGMICVPEWFGAVGDNVNDDTAAINAALASGFKQVMLAGKTYKTTDSLKVKTSGLNFFGTGPATVINIFSNTVSAIVYDPGLTNNQLCEMSIIRQGVAGVNAHGVDIPSSELMNISGVRAQYHFRGFNLGPTNSGWLSRSLASNNVDSGFHLYNSAQTNQMQWKLNNNLSQVNGNHGYVCVTMQGSTAGNVGTWTNNDTYANSGYGYCFVGLATAPLMGIRVEGGFIGEDGLGEIYLDTYGGMHIFKNMFIEIPGSRSTGPTLTTPATNKGDGIYVGIHNQDISVLNCYITGCRWNGIFSSASVRTQVVGCTITNNGQANSAGQRNGVIATAGTLMVSGCVIGNTAGSALSQSYGVYTDVGVNGGNVSLTGNNLRNNGGLGYLIATAPGSLVQAGNLV